jgi:hypothetical protein
VQQLADAAMVRQGKFEGLGQLSAIFRDGPVLSVRRQEKHRAVVEMRTKREKAFN